VTSLVQRTTQRIIAAFDDVLYPPHCIISGVALPTTPQRLPDIANDVLDSLSPAPTSVELMLMAQRHVGGDDLNIASFHSLWSVDHDTERAMYAIKYRGRTKLARAMGEMLGAFLSDEDFKCDAVVPVPIHSARRRERGYNQAECIANGVSSSLGVPIANVMQRTRYTGTQTSLSEHQRLSNVAHAFVVDPKASIQGARLLVVDDVLTTGATLNACAYALLDAGARRVDAATLCAA